MSKSRSSKSTEFGSPESPPPAPEAGSPAERRAHKRYDLDVVAGLSRDGEEFFPCHIRDFCLDGMLLAFDTRSHAQIVDGDNPIAPGESLNLRFTTNLNNESQKHQVRVKVARIAGEGIGVSFDGENAEAVWQLRQLARELRDELRENLAEDRRGRAPCAPMPVEQALNASQMLEVARKRLEEFLIAGMAALFKEADERLIAKANDVGSNSDQVNHLDAMKEVQDVRASVEAAYLDAVGREFTAMVDPDAVTPPDEPAGAQELALVDTGSFDDWLTTKNIISAAENDLKEHQYELEQRLTHLVNSPIDEENNPLGIGTLCLSFHDALQGLGASGQARRSILEAFEHAVVKNLQALYAELNAMFANGGILPTVERSRQVIKTPDGKQASLSEEVDEQAASLPDLPMPDDVEDDDSELDTNPEMAGRTPTVLPPLRLGSAFRAAGNLLNMQRAADASSSADPGEFMQGLEVWAPAQTTVEQQKDLLESLSILQRSPRFAETSDHGPLELGQKLNSTWRSAGLDASPDHHMMLDIVSNLIDSIMDDPFVSDEIKVRVRRLAVPILKVAFQDPTFFDNERHPARQVLDNLGRLDPDSTERFADIVDPVVKGILAGYDDDPSIFARALIPLKSEVSKQRKVFQQNLERLVSERQTQEEFIKSRQKDAPQSGETKSKALPANSQTVNTDADGEWEHWLNEARRCKPGDILSIEGRKGMRQKLSLAWISEDKGTFVLVDSAGRKAASMTTQELAMQMKRGAAVAEDIANMALTDRGTYRMLRSLHEQLARKASHDQLTDLLSRKEYEARLDELITDSVRSTTVHVAYALDVEGFQQIVEKAGKKVGKELLKKLARLLEKQVAKRGVVARLGTVRFGVLLGDTSLSDGRKVLERQREIIARLRCTWRGESFPLTSNAGILEINDMNEGVDATVESLDTALARAAKAGSAEIELIDTVKGSAGSQALKEAGTDTVLEMLNMDSLRLRCQRVVPLGEDGAGSPHYEILLGVQTDDGHVGLPADFIRAAERNREMQTVDRWVIKNVFTWISENQEKTGSVDGYSINLSSNSLSDDSVLEFVLEQFSETMVPPSKIIFEFPESAATANVSLTNDFVTTLKSYGCRFAIDDFGMADTSFSYLNSLPVDFVKIDGKLVVDILSSAKDLAVVRSINEIGHLLGKQTIAEFVENDGILARLRELGVDYAQGFGIEKPSLLESL